MCYTFQSSLQYLSLKRSVESNSSAQESVATTAKDTEEKTQEEDEEEERQRLTTELHEIERERWVLFCSITNILQFKNMSILNILHMLAKFSDGYY